MNINKILFIYIIFYTTSFCSSMVNEFSLVTVSSMEELQQSVDNIKNIKRITIKNGRYSNCFIHLNCEGTSNNIIEFLPETSNGVTFTGHCSFHIRGSWLSITGFRFESCSLKQSIITLDGAKHCQINRCNFLKFLNGNHPLILMKKNAVNNKIINCRFNTISGKCIQIKIGKTSCPEYNEILFNEFINISYNFKNGGETIQIGQNQSRYGMLESFTKVSSNIFKMCNGDPEIISNKSSKNMFIYNHFINCNGELTIRGGSCCTIESNRFEGCKGGIRIYGQGHKLIHNVIINCKLRGISLGYGMSDSIGGLYQTTTDCLISNNTIINAKKVGLYVGIGRNKDWSKVRINWKSIKQRDKKLQNIAPYNNTICNNIIYSTDGELLKTNNATKNIIERNLLYSPCQPKIIETGNNSILADPLFVNIYENNFTLAEKSPALEAGITLASVPNSINIGATVQMYKTGPQIIK